MKNISDRRRKLLSAMRITWVPPVVYSVVLPAHAVASPTPNVAINSVTISSDLGGNLNLRSISFVGQATSDSLGLFVTAESVITFQIKTVTDFKTFSIQLGPTNDGSPAHIFNSSSVLINNSTGGDIIIQANITLPVEVCDRVVLVDRFGTQPTTHHEPC